MQGPQLRQRRHHEAQPDRARRVQRDTTGRPHVAHPHPAFGLLHRFQYGPRFFQERMPLGRQGETSGRPVDQPRPQPILQPGQMGRNHGGRKRQPLGGAGEAARIHDGHENLKTCQPVHDYLS